MYEKIINLIIRINADVTLSDAAKNAIVELVETCTTEKEVIEMEKLLDMYAAHTEKIVETALARKTPEELKDINNGNLLKCYVSQQRGFVKYISKKYIKMSIKKVYLHVYIKLPALFT